MFIDAFPLQWVRVTHLDRESVFPASVLGGMEAAESGAHVAQDPE